MIKLDSIKNVSSSRISRNKKPGKSEQVFQVPTEAALPETHAVSSASSLDMVSTLMGLQEITSLTPQQRQLKDHGQSLLDELDILRMGILEGQFSSEHLKKISHSLRQQREIFDQSELASVVKEIEQRVAVEIAKLEMSNTTKKSLPPLHESSSYNTQKLKKI